MAKLKDLAKRESWREMSESHRAKIKASQIINRLNGAALGEIEMTATQLRAGLGLLAKVLPDLSASDNVTTHIQTDPVAAIATKPRTGNRQAVDFVAASPQRHDAPPIEVLHHEASNLRAVSVLLEDQAAVAGSGRCAGVDACRPWHAGWRAGG